MKFKIIIIKILINHKIQNKVDGIKKNHKIKQKLNYKKIKLKINIKL